MEYLREYETARRLGADVHLISLEALLEGSAELAVRRVPAFETPKVFIYRGWMLKPDDYERLYQALSRKNAILINSPEAYRSGHDFPRSYEAIKAVTPYSIWVPQEELKEGLGPLFEKMTVFRSKPVLVKDYVKSRKHEWEDACFIPDASDREGVRRVVENFLSRQGSELNGGVVIREFVPLAQLGVHPKSGMPLAQEYRLFFLDHKMIACLDYWDEAAYERASRVHVNLEPFGNVAGGIASRFFTMDIAKTAGGEWLVIEVGDGQVSGLPIRADVEQFYRSIKDGGATGWVKKR
ncbi:ATP-grasp domain-containing protein [Paenibacillus sp. A14]